jgi:xylitol oxidase
MDSLPKRGKELQSDYVVKIEDAAEALRAVASLGDRIRPVLRASELRTVAADDLWMSPCHQRPSLPIHFTWKPDKDGVRVLFPAIEDKLAPFEARPRGSKLFVMGSSILRLRYEKVEDFRKLARKEDAQGKCQDQFTREHLF